MKKRLYFLDNLKVMLTLLVVVHHVGQPYGGSNGFSYFISEGQTDLGRFFSINAGFFMSLFFLVSAYFLPGSFRKKGVKPFLLDRFIRLGIPLLFGFLVIMPLLMYFYYLNFRDYESISFFHYYYSVYFGLGGKPEKWSGPVFPDMQFGHLWFVEHLLVYAILYALIRKLTKREPEVKYLSRLTNGKLVLIALLVSAITYTVRIQYGIDHWEGLLGFIQVEYAHLPQYSSFFLLGILAFKYNWFERLDKRIGAVWLIIGVCLAALRYFTNAVPWSPGGMAVSSAVYSLYETFLCFGLGFGLIYLFKRIWNKSNPFLKVLSDNSFGVYIFHLPIAVIIQYSFAGAALTPFLKFVAVSIFTIAAAFLFSMLIRKIPAVRGII
ncbi:acyltransferase family protein [Peribacillus sp. SCS-37]|uniref:acyltransferase family protein n=1 Tax=Paraperibacillus esterisolvens TaxID=3115296 RepID=UPI003905B776